MAMDERTATTMGPPPMPTDAKLLTLVQWLSPAFPISGFAYSHGLETAVSDGRIHDSDTLQSWLWDILWHGSGRADAIWARLAYDAPSQDALAALNAQACAFVPAHRRLEEARKQGAAFTRTVNEVWRCNLPEVLLPLAVGAAARHERIDIDVAVPLYLQSFATNLVSACTRLMPLGQTDAQSIVAALHPACLEIAVETRGLCVEDVHSTAFVSDIMAMRHETLQPRLFHS